eukprot:TRINITY_DN1619_c0_g1_i1.p1 TRINITY_DN1619_c0_g1~~TRINITY_DN1619_c0_g1_i1.p1  ORF type:complete len:526 (+),score=114.68 TRINITY_DN1619_c0_g1_i1:180-1757(+)
MTEKSASLEKRIVYLDGENLQLEDLFALDSEDVSVEVTPEAWKRIEEGRKVVDELLKSNKVVYGINTGFGALAQVQIPKDEVSLLQFNLIRSHCAGVGEPLTPARTRRLLALRINVLAKGRSGIRVETVRKLVEACNKWCLPYIPLKGTVGASGDLAPLAHLALGMLGEGKMWDVTSRQFGEAANILKANGLTPVELKAKEGLAMINGTTFICSLGAEALCRAENLALVANIVGAMTLESLRGTPAAFNEMIHKTRPHRGQLWSARVLRALLHSDENPSEITHSHANCGKVQDSYTLRCMPQVHGVCYDTVQFVRGILTTEINSATDNPMVFAEVNRIMSGGNFHGQYPAKALDFLAIAVQDLANISERRMERLVNPNLSGHPAFLVRESGLNSGFMIAHCTAAALTSENKGLCHPSSTDTISTSAAQEDHVSMGGYGARKALTVVENTEHVLAIELLAACQAIDFMRPLKSTKVLEAVHEVVRSAASFLESDRVIQQDIESVRDLIVKGRIADAVRPFLKDLAW